MRQLYLISFIYENKEMADIYVVADSMSSAQQVLHNNIRHITRIEMIKFIDEVLVDDREDWK